VKVPLALDVPWNPSRTESEHQLETVVELGIHCEEDFRR
jgi:hypothetical protein